MKTKKSYISPAPVLWLAGLLVCVNLSGCIMVDANSTLAPDKNGAPKEQLKFNAGMGLGSEDGATVEKDDLASKSKQIELGKSKDFILGLLGEPKVKITEDNGDELWKWTYNETHTTFSSFIVLFASAKITDVEKVRYVEFKDGTVVKTWIE